MQAVSDYMKRETDLGELTWSLRSADGKVLVPDAFVPSHVHSVLVAAGRIPDPFFGTNEKAVQWVDEVGWTYAVDFLWLPDKKRPAIRLVFHGLDTLCSIFLDGEKIAQSENMFVPLELDLTGQLSAGLHALEIRFEPATSADALREPFLLENGLDPQTTGFFDRSFVRKAQYMFGWDWGPRLVSCGVWDRVEIIDFVARIVDVSTVQEHRDGKVAIEIKTKIEGAGRVRHRLFDADGHTVGELDGDGVVVVTRPMLWSPDHPNLYTLRTWIVDPSENLLDQQEINIGLRTVSLLEPPEFGFILNNEPIWIRGANWIPYHSLPAATSETELRNRLTEAKRMGMNMLRVWGGGLYESDAFYQLCDELGIMVWQDFAFACAYYPDDSAWQEKVRLEAESQVVRLRNHPSLAVWCGNNECQMMFDQRWGEPPHPARLPGERFYDSVLKGVVAQLDPTRTYIPGSPFGTAGRSNDGDRGDQHFWDVWHGRGDWIHYEDSDARFASEFGFLSSPSLTTWMTCLPDGDRDPVGEVVRWHNKSGKSTYHELIELHYPEIRTLEDLVYFSQLNQRDALRHGIEHFRLNGRCRGTLIWQFNDCWPVQSWSVLDSNGVWKAAAYDLPRLYNDVLVAVRLSPEPEVWIQNFGKSEVVDELLIGAYPVDARKPESECTQIRVGPGEIVRKPIRTVFAHGDQVLIRAAFNGQKAWKLACPPKTISRDAKPVTIRKVEGHFELTTGSRTVVDLWLYDRRGQIKASENFFTLVPGELATVRLYGPLESLRARSLLGEHRIEWLA